jgi:hypothetical protein
METNNDAGGGRLARLVLALDDHLATWGPHCGAPKAVYEGQLRVMLRKIFDLIEESAEANMMKTGKLEGMHYAAMKKAREALQIPRQNENSPSTSATE